MKENMAKTKFKKGLIKRGEPWPEWANFIVGVAEGFEAFEDEKSYEKFLKNYREKHKNDVHIPYKPEEDETPRMGKIGF